MNDAKKLIKNQKYYDVQSHLKYEDIKSEEKLYSKKKAALLG